MAEQRSTTSRDSTHSLSNQASVSELSGRGAGMDRRQAMNVMTAIAAVPAVGISKSAIAHVGPDRRAWEQAYERFQRAKRESERLFGEHSAAEVAWDAACPRESRFFDEFNLGIGIQRDRVLDRVRHKLGTQQGISGIVMSPPASRKAYEAKLDAISNDARQITDHFMAYQDRHNETKSAFRVEELWQRATDFDDECYFPARDELMRLPAPDEAALLVIMEVSCVSLDDEHAESVLADARRLLASSKAVN